MFRRNSSHTVIASEAKQSPVVFLTSWTLYLHIMEYVMTRQPAIYILTNKKNGTLYTGVTSNLPRRIWEHKNKITQGFSAKYKLNQLVYFEVFDEMYLAISREKQIKGGSRKAKIKLIESINQDWKDLYPDIV